MGALLATRARCLRDIPCVDHVHQFDRSGQGCGGAWGQGSFALCGGATGEFGARVSPPAAVGPQECAEQGKPADCHGAVGNPKGWASLPASVGLLVVVGEGRANQQAQ